jgi:murein L,D-transpeptidase YcbB/YkuD
LEVAANAAGALDLGELRMSYKNAANGGSGVFAKRVSVEVTLDEAAADRSVDRTVTVEATLAETERKQKEQVKLFESGRRDEATRNLSAISKDLEDKNAAWKDPRVKKKIEALSVENRQMTAAASPEAQSSYLKASKNRLYQAKQGKRALQQLQVGDKGMEVERLQESLKKQGYYSGPVDGVYDADVKRAVESYQNAKSVEVDGVAGAATMDALGMY